MGNSTKKNLKIIKKNFSKQKYFKNKEKLRKKNN